MSALRDQVFINYRKRNTRHQARLLAQELFKHLGTQRVFLDQTGIQAGHLWEERIFGALERCRVMIVLLGPRWLTIDDEFGRRRIDDPDDWVRREIEYALERADEVTLIPMLCGIDQLPPPKALPNSLQPLLASQAMIAPNEEWEPIMPALIDRVREAGVARSEPQVEFPVPHDKIEASSDEDLQQTLETFPDWELVKGEPYSKSPSGRELRRTFKFSNFEDAMQFMTATARLFSKDNHHPRWMNVWTSVTVWLTTWDIGGHPSFKDIDLVHNLERVYRELEY